MRYRAFRYLGIACFAAWNTVASGEILVGIANPSDTIPTCVRGDDRLGYRYRDHCKEWIVRGGKRSWMSYNAAGLRDRDYSASPQPGVRRLLFVGPSNLAAPGLPEDQSPPRLLEKMLRKADPRVEVINGGVEGYMAVRTAILLPELLARYHPTHVLYLTSFSSSSDQVLDSVTSWRDSAPERIRSRAGEIFANHPWLLRAFQSALPGQEPYRLLEDLLQGLNNLGRTYRCRYGARDKTGEAACYLAPPLRAMQSMRIASERAGARFLSLYTSAPIRNIYLTFPGANLRLARAFDAVTPEIALPGGLPGELLATYSIPSAELDLQRLKEISYLAGDHHFDEQGADIFSQAIASALPVSFWERSLRKTKGAPPIRR